MPGRYRRNLTSLAFLFLCFSTGALPVWSDERPNIIVFLVDDMGVMDTSVPFLVGDDSQPKRYPLNDFFRTPNMERLAIQGIRFNQFQAMSVCSPTRISIMTGQNAARHRTTNWIAPGQNNRTSHGPAQWNWKGLDKTSVALPRLLQQTGYRTIHIGKGHFGPNGSAGADPRNIGFDVNIGGSAIGHPGSYFGKKNFGAGGTHGVPHLQPFHGTETFLTEVLTESAKSEIDIAIRDDKPFFLYLAHYAVHSPFESDPRFAPNYQTSGKSKQAQAFATLIEGMDKSLGDIMDHVNQSAAKENTILIFLGDNGSDAPLGPDLEVACAEPLRGRKGTHYEGGMRIPFVAAWLSPNKENPVQKNWPIKADSIQTQLSNVTDLFPTILELADVKASDQHTVDGQSLSRLLQGDSDPAHSDEFLMHFPHGNHRSNYFTSFRKGDWKVVYHYFPEEKSAGTRYQLFHLKNDPFESTDLAKQEPKKLFSMMEGLVNALHGNGALYPEVERNQEIRPALPLASVESK